MSDPKNIEKVQVGELSRTRPAAKSSIDQRARDQSYGHRSLVKAWKDQQQVDRELRSKYAKILISFLLFQMMMIDVFIGLIGWRIWGFEVEKWLGQSFLVTTFLEISSLVVIVAKYLFPPPTEKALEVISTLNSREKQSVSRPKPRKVPR